MGQRGRVARAALRFATAVAWPASFRASPRSRFRSGYRGIRVVDARFAGHAHRLGMQVHVLWTIDDPA